MPRWMQLDTSRPEPKRGAGRPTPRLLLVVLALLAAVALGACDLLPQTGTEWGVALGIFGALFITVVIVAWRAAKKANKK